VLSWWKDPAEKLSARVISEKLAKIFLKNEIGRIGLEEFLFNDEITKQLSATIRWAEQEWVMTITIRW